MQHPALLFLIPLFVVLFIGGMWALITLLLSRLGGWNHLAQQFAARHPPAGKKFRSQSARLNLVRYNNCLTIYVSTEGLYLHMIVVFRLGHPDLLIPWSELHDPVTEQILWSKFVTLQVGHPTLARLRLSDKLFQELPAIS